MSSVLARTGRHRQRYDNNVRLVSGCIPYRIATKIDEGSYNLENMVEVLMVSSPNRSDLVFPKGGWEDDETDREAACREAIEEAGVIGILRDKPLGVWEFRSKSSSPNGGCRGVMFALKVTEELETWPEQETKDRKWLNIKDAFTLCRYEWLRQALEKFLIVMADEKKPELPKESKEKLAIQVKEVGDCTIISPNSYIKPSTDQKLNIGGSTIPFSPWQVPLKRLPLT